MKNISYDINIQNGTSFNQIKIKRNEEGYNENNKENLVKNASPRNGSSSYIPIKVSNSEFNGTKDERIGHKRQNSESSSSHIKSNKINKNDKLLLEINLKNECHNEDNKNNNSTNIKNNIESPFNNQNNQNYITYNEAFNYFLSLFHINEKNINHTYNDEVQVTNIQSKYCCLYYLFIKICPTKSLSQELLEERNFIMYQMNNQIDFENNYYVDIISTINYLVLKNIGYLCFISENEVKSFEINLYVLLELLYLIQNCTDLFNKLYKEIEKIQGKNINYKIINISVMVNNYVKNLLYQRDIVNHIINNNSFYEISHKIFIGIIIMFTNEFEIKNSNNSLRSSRENFDVGNLINDINEIINKKINNDCTIIFNKEYNYEIVHKNINENNEISKLSDISNLSQ